MSKLDPATVLLDVAAAFAEAKGKARRAAGRRG